MATVNKRTWTSNGAKKTAWVVRYQHDGSRKQATFEKKKEADTFLDKVKKEIRDDVHFSTNAKKTVQEIGDLYLRSLEDRGKQEGLSKTHLRLVRGFLTTYVYPTLGNQLFANLEIIEIE